jgi:hypothetical protein
MKAKPLWSTALACLLLAGSIFAAPPECSVDLGKPAVRSTMTEGAWRALSEAKLSLINMAETAFVLTTPTTERAFRNIFGERHTASAANLRQMQTLAAKASKEGIQAYTNESYGAKDVKRLLEDPTLKLVVLAGHNEKGRLKLPDGTSLSIRSILAQSTGRKLVIVVACNVQSEARFIAGLVNQLITPSDALSLVSKYERAARKLQRSGSSMSYGRFVDAERSTGITTITLKIADQMTKFKVRVETSGTVQVVTVYAICPADSATCD